MVYRHFCKQLFETLAYPLLLSACIVVVACNTDKGKTPVNDAHAREQIKQLNEKGEKARDNSRFDEAIKLHNEELSLATSIGDTINMVRALNNIGTNYRRLDMLEEAGHYHEDALQLTERSTNQSDEEVRKNRLISLNGLGNVYLKMGELKRADSIFREALEGEKKLGSKIGQAINLANIGSVKEKQGLADSAWMFFRYSLVLNKQANSKLGESLCFSHFGSLHEADGNIADALEEYKHAYEVMADRPDDWHKLEAGVNVARLTIQLGEYQRAEEYLKEVDATACRIHSLDHQSRIHDLYYQLYEKKGDIRNALKHHILCTQLKDSLIDDSKSNQIQKMRTNLEREQNRDRLRLLNKQYQTERWALRLIILLLLLALLATTAVIISQRRKLRKYKNN